MPPSPTRIALNHLFEPAKPVPGRFPEQNMKRLEPMYTALDSLHMGERYAYSETSSPASTTSTLAMDEDEIRSIFASEKNPTDLNPMAVPFVPTHSRPVTPRGSAPPKHASQPTWAAAFQKGACTSSNGNHHLHADAVVSSLLCWTADALAELAQYFCCKGSERVSEESAGVASFALMVYQKFWKARGEQTAVSFVWHLREQSLASFKKSWDPVSAFQTHFCCSLLTEPL